MEASGNIREPLDPVRRSGYDIFPTFSHLAWRLQIAF